jgi:hypothetical protein
MNIFEKLHHLFVIQYDQTKNLFFSYRLIFFQNLWLRLGVIEYVNSICEKSHLADVHGFVLPVIEQYFKFPIIQVENAVCNQYRFKRIFNDLFRIFYIMH